MIDQWSDNPPLVPMFPYYSQCARSLFSHLHGTKKAARKSRPEATPYLLTKAHTSRNYPLILPFRDHTLPFQTHSNKKQSSMRLFTCDNCKNVVFFDNRQCVQCKSRLAYEPVTMTMRAISSEAAGSWRFVEAKDWMHACAQTHLLKFAIG